VEKEKEKEVDRGMRFVHLGGQEESSAVLPCEPSIKGTAIFHPPFFSTKKYYFTLSLSCLRLLSHCRTFLVSLSQTKE
jgi:hypothetical protein